MKTADELVDFISPSIRLAGRSQFVYSIKLTCDMLKENMPSEAIRITQNVYQPVAEKFHSKLEAAERAIYRAVESCWNDGKNENVHKIIGRKLPQKPSPKEFILYCAYYLFYGRPYHNASKEGKLPLVF